MSDILLQAINGFHSSRNRVKEKMIILRSSLDKAILEMDKSDSPYEKMLTELREYQKTVNKFYEKRIKELESEVEVLTKQVAGFTNLLLNSDNGDRETYQKLSDPNNWYVKDEDGDLVFVSDSTSLKIASTVSILDVLVREISIGPDGNWSEGFERICFSILYPAIYSKLGQESGDKFYLTKVPESVDDIVMLGKEFHEEIFPEITGHLTHSQHWEKHCKTITDWWIDSMIPMIYFGVDLDLSDIEPYSCTQMKNWAESREDRGLEFGEVSDVIDISNRFLFEVIPQNGLKELSSKIDSGYFNSIKDILPIELNNL